MTDITRPVAEQPASFAPHAPVGRTLEHLLATGAEVPTERVLAIVRGVADALDAAHAKGLLHRALAPSRIVLGDDGGVVVTGFPVPGEPMTDPTTDPDARPYAAPELWRRRRMDSRSDQYALAVIALELLTGERRQGAVGVEGIPMLEPIEINGYVPVRRDLGLRANNVLRTALSGSPHNRYPTCRLFADALAGKASDAVSAAGWSTIYPDIGPARRSHVGAVLFLAVLAGSTAVAVHEPWRAGVTRWWRALQVEVDVANARLDVALPGSGGRASGGGGTAPAPAPASASPRVYRSAPSRAGTPAGGGSFGATASRASSASGGGSTGGGTSSGTLGRGSLSPTSSPGEPSFVSRALGRGSALLGGERRTTASGGAASSPGRETSASTDASVRVTAAGGSPVVLVDGIPRGTAPLIVRVPPGTHTVEVRSVGARYAPARRVVQVRAGGGASASFTRQDR